MKISGNRFIVFGAGVALAVGVEHATDAFIDHRPEYPAGVVCVVPLDPGDSPHDLAGDSMFKANAQTVIQRSQFINPDAVMRHSRHDEGHFGEGSLFNVMLKDGTYGPVTAQPTAASGIFNAKRLGAKCLIADSSRSALVSDFPDINAATRILSSTVAVIENNPRDTQVETTKFRRCGAIAVGANTLLLPSSEYVSSEHECAQLRSGETDTQSVEITDDQNVNQWRFLSTKGAKLEPVRAADEYVPKSGDRLVYSGYGRDGNREYFRVLVVGSKDGRILFRAGVDQSDPDPQHGYRKLHGGTGGFFTYDGSLVAVTEDSAQLKPFSDSYSQEYYNYIRQHNSSVSDLTEEYGLNIDYSQGSYIKEQFVTGLRVTSKDVADAEIVTTRK